MVLEAVGISPEKIQAELERKTDRNETVAGVDTVTLRPKSTPVHQEEEAHLVIRILGPNTSFLHWSERKKVWQVKYYKGWEPSTKS